MDNETALTEAIRAVLEIEGICEDDECWRYVTRKVMRELAKRDYFVLSTDSLAKIGI